MSDITATTVTADGVAVNHPARVKGMYFVRAATAGSVVLKDGGSYRHDSSDHHDSSRWLWRG